MRVTVERYLESMGKLVALINAGEGDNKEADDLRDQMDGLWYDLTAAECEYVNGLTVKMEHKDE